MVHFSYPADYKIQMPTHDQMVGLLAISRSCLFPKAPPLRDTADEQLFFTAFIASFRYISTLKRCDEMSRIDVWLDRCSRWTQERMREYIDLGGPSPFLCAAAACGDVGYRLDLGKWPNDIFVGLSWSDGAAATAEGWRHVLATRKTREPVPLPKSLQYPAPTTTIREVASGLIHSPFHARPFE
jgi:hypothetical protein